ncbi:dicarboxylate transport [Plasticicumulans lactativorans]|uniref:Dicarboxylate transport n=1 Tax=Plasticicumulans lactativorans TaxID=1133106 RepID=A0A4R2LIS0_9GAMM|nr:YdbH domain-containing protein [Plasticicumulans lactativorans]TCO83045.1 dicarboxylate transport [Plasticicumulans lactativorans]
MTPPAPRGHARPRRRRWYLPAALAALLAAGAVLAPPGLGWLAGRALRDAGFAVAELDIDHLAPSGARATLDLGAAGHIARIELDYGLRDLLAGRVEAVRLDGVQLRLTQDAAGSFGLAGRTPPGPSAAVVLPALPARHVTLSAATVTLERAGAPSLDVPLALTLEPAADGTTRIEGRLGPVADATAQLAGTFDADGRLALTLEAGVDDAGALAARLGRREPLSGALRLRVQVAGRPGGPPASVAVALDGQGLGWGDWLQDGRLAAHGRFDLGEGGRYAWRADAPLSLELVPGPALRAHLPPALAREPLRLALQPTAADAALFDVTADGGALRGSARTALTLGRAGLGGTLGLRWQGGRLELDLVDGEIGLPDVAMAGSGLALHLGVATAAPRPVDGTLRIDALHSTARPALHAPLRLDGRLDGALDDTLALHLDLDALAGRAQARLEARHTFADGRGEARLRSARLELAPDTLPLPALLPALAGQVRSARGTTALDLRYAWSADGTRERAEWLLQDLDLDTPLLRARRINAVLRADRLLPLRIPRGQTIAIAALDAGLALHDGELEFALDDDRLQLLRAGFDWAGGRLRVAPFTTRLGAREYRLDVEAQDLDLGELFALVSLPGLSAEGRIHGRLPVRLRADGRLAVADGRLAADAPGRIRYRPETPPSFLAEGQAAIALQALTDFRYTALSLGLDGDSGGEMRLQLALRGANPDFHGGHPVAFNLNLSGALASILQRSLESYRLPDSVREQIEQYGRSP